MTTTGDLLTLTANSATSATGLLTIDGGNAMTSGGALNITGTTYNHGADFEEATLVAVAYSDTTSGAFNTTTYGLASTRPSTSPPVPAPKTTVLSSFNHTSVPVPPINVCPGLTDARTWNDQAINVGSGWDTYSTPFRSISLVLAPSPERRGSPRVALSPLVPLPVMVVRSTPTVRVSSLKPLPGQRPKSSMAVLLQASRPLLLRILPLTPSTSPNSKTPSISMRPSP